MIHSVLSYLHIAHYLLLVTGYKARCSHTTSIP